MTAISLMQLDILYADDAMVVLNKPSGLHSVPGRGEDKQDCLSARVQRQYPDALVVHRLDRDTSGVLVMARGKANQRIINLAFEKRQIDKRYLAQVHGLLPLGDDWKQVDQPILLDWERRPLRIIDPAGQASQTRWRCMRRDEERGISLVELEPLTGRSHQLRIHMQWLGFPMLGDTLYAPAPVQLLAPRLMLHAQSIGLAHPISQAPVQFSCDANFEGLE